MGSKKYLGWESNLSITPSIFFWILSTQFQWTQINERDGICNGFANNTKWVSSQVLRCDRAKLGPLGRRHLHHLIFITELLLVWALGHADPHLTDWITKPSQVPREFELATYQFECDALTYRAIHNTLYCIWRSDRGMGRRGRIILK